MLGSGVAPIGTSRDRPNWAILKVLRETFFAKVVQIFDNFLGYFKLVSLMKKLSGILFRLLMKNLGYF